MTKKSELEAWAEESAKRGAEKVSRELKQLQQEGVIDEHGRLKEPEITGDQIEELVNRAWGTVPRSPLMDRLMRPVFTDIAVQVLREDSIDEAFARRMGMDLSLVEHIVEKMKG